MPKKNRGYKRGEPFRSAKLILIVTEGSKTEVEYLDCFPYCSQKIKIKFIEPLKEGESAPKHFIPRVEKFKEDFDLGEEDSLWFVCDKDRWQERHLHEIAKECQEKSNWNLAISNPCFEVWLYMHFWDISTSSSKTSKALKTEFNVKTSSRGGYNPKELIAYIDAAIDQARKTDENPRHFMPEFNQTKFYLLAETILEIIGENWKDQIKNL